MKSFTDLYCGVEAVKEAYDAGYDKVCIAIPFSKNALFDKEVKRIRSDHPDVMVGAVISKDIQTTAKKAMTNADLVIADVSASDGPRYACECWEVDLIVNPERNEDRDKLYNPASGLDMVCASMASERGIGYIINIANVIGSRGISRSRTIARISQNIKLCTKVGMPTILTSGAVDGLGIRNPQDIINLSLDLGMDEGNSQLSLTRHPSTYLKRASDRKDPNIITDGLRVLEWGGQNRKDNKKFGWY